MGLICRLEYTPVYETVCTVYYVVLGLKIFTLLKLCLFSCNFAFCRHFCPSFSCPSFSVNPCEPPGQINDARPNENRCNLQVATHTQRTRHPRSGTDLISLVIFFFLLFLLLLLLLGPPPQKAKGSVVARRIRMKFGGIFFTHRLTVRFSI